MIQIMFIYMFEFLVALQQLFRHGAKNPSGFYPNDPHAAHDWQEGLGALTQASIESNRWLGFVTDIAIVEGQSAVFQLGTESAHALLSPAAIEQHLHSTAGSRSELCRGALCGASKSELKGDKKLNVLSVHSYLLDECTECSGRSDATAGEQ